MNEGLVQVKNKGLTTAMLWHLLINDSILLRHRILAESASFLQLIQMLLGKVKLLLQVLIIGLCCDS